MPPWDWPRAAYVHIPFCAYHCGYCDFAIAVGKDERIDAYLDALERELSRLGRPFPVETLFLGGGTPSYLNCRQLEKLLDALGRWLPRKVGFEFTIEANPGTLDEAKVNILADHGVNRISLGVQSFHPHLLKVLERDHIPPDVYRSLEAIRKRIANVCLDLIFGVPGQRLADWQSDLKEALALGPAHLSTYGLTFEKGTPLWKKRYRGALQSLGEEEELAMFELAMDVLTGAGFDHYEISNFARPGWCSRHNLVYWANHAYLGFGMGAARYVHGCRELNTCDLAAYISRSQADAALVFQAEKLSPPERARETMALQLRRADGIQRNEFFAQTGFDLDQLAGPAIARLVELALLADTGGAVRLTRRGKCLADSVIQELL